MKRRRTGKDAGSSKDPRSKEKRSTSSSKEASKSRHTSSGKSINSEEPSHNVEDISKHQDQEYVMGKQTYNPMIGRLLKPTGLRNLKDLPLLILTGNNPENKPYPFNLRKPLPLIQDRRGRQIIPKYYFINKDLEYLQGGDSSRSYSTSVTKTKAASDDLKWIKDMVYDLWCPSVVKYDQYALYGILQWGPKRQSFYYYASNLTSSKDVYSGRRIIVVTRLKIQRKYDYGYIEEIEVFRDNQQIYTFKEGDFLRLRL
uniref:Uncharacterized protein n=1 Tax=Tanacetum cinerariifolium TaxID=118510 RepID=A0A6L2M3W7_TANCI|nr:hypothetical protein [Tanacetum cinerariifolium]